MTGNGTARPFDLRPYPSSGYYILDQPAGRLIADYGAPGSSYNPGHQHAGIFGYEISAEQGRVIVDTGAAGYEAGAERDSLRATAAHNTIRVDETNQFRVWGAFRVGRRAFVHDVQTLSGRGWHSITGRHDGYRHVGVIHRRTIIGLEGAGWLVGDFLGGGGCHAVESFIHLHPGIEPVGIEPGRGGSKVALAPLGWTLAAVRMPPLQVKHHQYSTRLGDRQPSRSLFVHSRVEPPLLWAYWIAPFRPEQVHWETSDGGILALTAGEKRFHINLSEEGPIETTLEI